MLSVFKVHKKLQEWKCSQITVIHQSDDERGDDDEDKMRNRPVPVYAPLPVPSPIEFATNQVTNACSNNRSQTPNSCGTIFEEDRYESPPLLIASVTIEKEEEKEQETETNDWVVVFSDNAQE
jgi:hypothetical protein